MFTQGWMFKLHFWVLGSSQSLWVAARSKRGLPRGARDGLALHVKSLPTCVGPGLASLGRLQAGVLKTKFRKFREYLLRNCFSNCNGCRMSMWRSC